MESENITEAMVPYFPDDKKKSKYLSFRVTGFTIRESLNLAGVTEASLRRWRRIDPEFAQFDSGGISELKKKFSTEYINLQFTRNMHLVLQKDFAVLVKSIKHPDTMDDREQAYLLKLRGFYTPQQLAQIQQVIGEISNQENFTDIVLRISREREELSIVKRTEPAKLQDATVV